MTFKPIEGAQQGSPGWIVGIMPIGIGAGITIGIGIGIAIEKNGAWVCRKGVYQPAVNSNGLCNKLGKTRNVRSPLYQQGILMPGIDPDPESDSDEPNLNAVAFGCMMPVDGMKTHLQRGHAARKTVK